MHMKEGTMCRDNTEEKIMYFVQSPENCCSNDHFLISPSRSDSGSFLNSPTPHDLFSSGADHEKLRRVIIVDDDEEDHRSRWCRKYCTFDSSDSWEWIFWQITWRLAVSLGAALLVFYTAVKPPPPGISIKVTGIPEFGLAEGVDVYGISTKILTCNCSINLEVENKSKLFGLHIHPSVTDLKFGSLQIATVNGPKLYAESYGSTRFELWVGTRNRALYGAGRNMQDMLDSRSGLRLAVYVSLTSNFHVMIKPSFHYRGSCLLLLTNTYDKRLQTQQFKSTCTILT